MHGRAPQPAYLGCLVAPAASCRARRGAAAACPRSAPSARPRACLRSDSVPHGLCVCRIGSKVHLFALSLPLLDLPVPLFGLSVPLLALPVPLFALPVPLFAWSVALFALSAPVSITQHSTPLGACTWQRRAQSRYRCGGPSPGADVAGVRRTLRRTPALSVIRSCRALDTSSWNTKQQNTTLSRAELSTGGYRAIGTPSTVLCLGWRTGGLVVTCRRASWLNRVAAACDVARFGGNREGRRGTIAGTDRPGT